MDKWALMMVVFVFAMVLSGCNMRINYLKAQINGLKGYYDNLLDLKEKERQNDVYEARLKGREDMLRLYRGDES